MVYISCAVKSDQINTVTSSLVSNSGVQVTRGASGSACCEAWIVLTAPCGVWACNIDVSSLKGPRPIYCIRRLSTPLLQLEELDVD